MRACQKGTVIIMGDFNRYIDWKNQIGKGSVDRSSLNVFGIVS